MSFVIEGSPNAGYFRINNIDYPKGHFRLKYDNLQGSESERNFSLYNIYDESNILTSRGYLEVQGVGSWNELLRLLNIHGVLFNNNVSPPADSLPIFQFADTVGDGSGNSNMNVDASIANVEFKVVPPAGKIYGIARLILSIRDSGSMDSGGWGSMGQNPLTNGFKLIWHRLGQDIDLTVTPITSHIDIAAVCHDMIHNSWGQGDEFLTARFTFTKSGNYIMLDGDKGDYISVIARDDLTPLVQQRVSFQGYQK